MLELRLELFLFLGVQVCVGDRCHDRLFDQRRHRIRLLGFGEHLAQLDLHLAHGARQLFGLLAMFLQSFDDSVEHLAGFVDQPRNGSVRAHGIAVAATGAVFCDELGMFEADRGHVAEVR